MGSVSGEDPAHVDRPANEFAPGWRAAAKRGRGAKQAPGRRLKPRLGACGREVRLRGLG